ncbi:hypothetical protein SAMN05192558_107185 [Actinokineospora alba]|uniref:Uncharacterized protein n=1 Tax=Actinokineospora alba TaxID=504798 RepID=A0A1H0QYG3_9PSEU|nr:hypothetical protein [Actinokineospora alba]TDP70356.1 hypothetical protein C8E96_5966 [Actinokineospora alba]SDI33431.1 hypothetical protein SAMN05421871_104184 [Actinokineospora alba]SDP21778.1 hypothetical protein SAMN05192558_107185 [Actinokineospora alba]
MTRVNKITAGNDSTGSKLRTAMLVGMLAVAVAGAASPVAGGEAPNTTAARDTSPGQLAAKSDDWPWRVV